MSSSDYDNLMRDLGMLPDDAKRSSGPTPKSATSKAPTAAASTASAAADEAIRRILHSSSFFVRLGLPEVATSQADLRKQYKSLALMIHPDKCALPEATQAFQRLSESFEKLYDLDFQKSYLLESKRGAFSGKKRSYPQYYDSSSSSRKKGKGSSSKSYYKDEDEEFDANYKPSPWEEILKDLKRKEDAEAKLRRSFVARQSSSFQDKKATMQLAKILRLCHEIDLRQGNKSGEVWDSEEDMKEIAEELTPQERPKYMQLCLDYLRDRYNHCFFCGITFNDPEDLQKNCPGTEEADHD